MVTACSERITEDQHVQGTKRQTYLHSKLLQGYRQLAA